MRRRLKSQSVKSTKPPKVLEIDQKQKTSYCIPLWLRDEQIRLAIARKLPRIQPYDGEKGRPDKVAVVCYGPSLSQTWEEIKNFKYIITCSGAHKFLIDRDIIPTWHVEVDPREHKIKLIGDPHKDVEYLVASTCHPKVFEHLEGQNVKLWHVFDNDAEAKRVLPPGEWALTGGCDVGLRAMAIAHFFGFVDLHVFGKDGCMGDTGYHASEHPNQAPPQCFKTEYRGKTYYTTPSILEAAKQTFHELDVMPDVKVKFYGEGLVQEMFKDYKPKYKPGQIRPILGIVKQELISSDYKELNKKLHEDNLAYGVGGDRHLKIVLNLCEKFKTKNVLDYGCGKGRLARAMPWQIAEYDPAIPGKEQTPKPADIVICTDVLEHIEPDKLDFVLDDLHRCTLMVGYFTIHTGPAMKTLADGRNAHLIQQNDEWWAKKLAPYFLLNQIIKLVDKEGNLVPELHVTAAPRKIEKVKQQKAA